ncbi:hypothetical protein [Frondihabitans australicus]|uniref:Uncharacterized protein n=1 Tax=Frondihabitans australicus TaxID=386892 RepID=A0A495IL99_9MICO|nr:hypothetical protein [Frondihabitans australicus]RKR76208.1 hypothetical protein C8E83_3373 [Frondihabitans australicus]
MHPTLAAPRRALDHRVRLLVSEPGQIGALVVAVTVWRLSGSPWLGWAACFGSIALLVAHATRRLPHQTGSVDLRRRLTRAELLSPAMLRLYAIAAGIAGIIATAPLHFWSVPILAGAIMLSAATVFAASALSARRPPAGGDDGGGRPGPRGRR